MRTVSQTVTRNQTAAEACEMRYIRCSIGASSRAIDIQSMVYVFALSPLYFAAASVVVVSPPLKG